jgi:two-component system sensor histidine kinase SenX3
MSFCSRATAGNRAYHRHVGVAEAFTLGVTAGLVTAVLAVVSGWLLLRRQRRRRAILETDHDVGALSFQDRGEVDRGGVAGHLSRQAIEALRASVLLLGPDDQVRFANPSAVRLGLVRDADKRTGIGHPALRSLAIRVRRSGRTRDVRLELPRPDGRPLGVRARAVCLGGGHVAIEVEDVSEAYRVARVRRDLVANLSHELKTPVGALRLLSEALVDASDELQGAETAELRRFAARILHESGRLSRLVTELLELSRLEGGEPLPEPERVAVDRILHEVLDRSRTAASAKEITVRLDGRRGLQLHGHERLLVTAVVNLVDNAIAYSPGGTTVTIATRRSEERVEISVSDEGIGIAPEDQTRIFERFYRVDRARSRATGGTGLGLAIVKHVATNHGGTVSVRSALGDGSRFTLTLPVRPPATGGTTPGDATPDDATAGDATAGPSGDQAASGDNGESPDNAGSARIPGKTEQATDPLTLRGTT